MGLFDAIFPDTSPISKAGSITSQGYDKAASTLGQYYDTAQNYLGGALSGAQDALTSGAGTATDWLTQALTSGTAALTGSEGAATSYLQNALGAGSTDVLTSLQNALNYLGGGTSQAAGFLEQALPGWQSLLTTGQAGLDLYGKLTGVGPGGVGDIQATLESIPGYQAIRDATLQALDRTATVGGRYNPTDIATAAGNVADQSWQELVGNLSPYFGLATTAAGGLTGGLTSLANLYAGQGATGAGLISGAGTELAGMAGTAGTALANLASQLGSNLSNLGTSLYGGMADVASGLGSNLSNLISGTGAAQAGLASQQGTALAQTEEQKAQAQADTLAQIFNANQAGSQNFLGLLGSAMNPLAYLAGGGAPTTNFNMISPFQTTTSVG